MFRRTILDIFIQIWPMVLICVVIVSSLRIAHIIKNKEKVLIHKEMLNLAFIIYILCLFYVVTFQDVSWSSSNFIPFKEMFRYDFGTRLFFKNVVGNMIIFIPYGFFISHYLKLKKPWILLVLTIITSITIETTQLIIGRVFDIDDILLNIIGGILGGYIFIIVNSIQDKLPNALKKDWFYNIIVIVIVILMVLYLSNVFSLGV